MERVDALREQAAVMRGLAKTIGIQRIRAQLLDLAEQCDRLAAERLEMLKRKREKDES